MNGINYNSGSILGVQDDSISNNKIKPESFMTYLPVDVESLNYTITTTLGQSRTTKVYYSIIDKQYKPELLLANDDINNVENPVDAASRTNSTILTNAGVFGSGGTTNTNGIIVTDGTCLHENDWAEHMRTSDVAVLYMTEDGTLSSISTRSTTEEIMNQHPKWAVQGFYPIINDGEFVGSGHVSDDYEPLTCLGQDYEGNYIVIVCEGRNYDSLGMSLHNMNDFVRTIMPNIRFLYNLDGGGSSVIVDKGIRLSKFINDEDRSVANFISFRLDPSRIMDDCKQSKAVMDKFKSEHIDSNIYKNRFNWYAKSQNTSLSIDYYELSTSTTSTSNWNTWSKVASFGYLQGGDAFEVKFMKDISGTGTLREQSVFTFKIEGYLYINGNLIASDALELPYGYHSSVSTNSKMFYCFRLGNFMYINAQIVVSSPIQRYQRVITNLDYVGDKVNQMNPRYKLETSTGQFYKLYVTRYQHSSDPVVTRTALCADEIIPEGNYYLNAQIPIAVG